MSHVALSALAVLGSIPSDSSRKSIYGIVGTILLLSGYYLIVITSKSKVGTINDHDIWKVERFEMIPYKKNENYVNESEVSSWRGGAGRLLGHFATFAVAMVTVKF